MAAGSETQRVFEGRPNPLGATWDGLGVNFALFSANATRVELCLFDESRHDRTRAHRTAGIHRRGLARLPAEARPGTVYGYRVHGPTRPRQRAPVQPQQARASTPSRSAVVGEIDWDPAVFGYQMESGDDIDLRHARQRAFVPKARVIDNAFTWGRDHASRRPTTAPSSTRRMSRGFTMRHPRVPEALRGTFTGLTHPDVIAHMKASASPRSSCCRCTASCTTATSSRTGMRNYWGYNTLGVLRAGARLRQRAGFRHRVQGDGGALSRRRPRGHPRRRLQPHGRGQREGPTFSFKGIDNASYYRLLPRSPLLHQRHRDRQHGEPQPSPRAADGDGQLRYWARGDARRRLPLRSWHDPRARADTASTRVAASSIRAGRIQCCPP